MPLPTNCLSLSLSLSLCLSLCLYPIPLSIHLYLLSIISDISPGKQHHTYYHLLTSNLETTAGPLHIDAPCILFISPAYTHTHTHTHTNTLTHLVSLTHSKS